MYGSVSSGLSCKVSSDIDLTIIINDLDISHDVILRAIMDSLEKCSMRSGRYMIEFNMPRRDKAGFILKVYDTMEKLRIDIMVNKVAEIVHAQLFKEYSRLDERFRKLVIFFKHLGIEREWSKQTHLNHFSLYLLLLSYMQSQRMIPNLQALENELNQDHCIL